MRPRIKRTPVDVRVFDNYIRLGFTNVEASKKLRELEFKSELNFISL